MGLRSFLARIFRRSAAVEPRPLALPAAPVEAPLADPVRAAALSIAASAMARGDAEASAGAGIAKASTSITEAPGVPGFSVYGGRLDERERAADMNGAAKWRRFGEMARNVAMVGAPLRRYLTLAGAPGWKVPAWKARDVEAPDADDVLMAEFAEDQLANLATPWPTVVMSAAMSRWNGSTIQVWAARAISDGEHAGMVGLADVVDRPMHTIEEWTVDERGNVVGVVQRAPQGAGMHPIDRARMVWSRDIPITDSPAGVGIFRQVSEAVRQLEALFKQLHQGLETDLAGIPVVYGPIDAVKRLVNTTVGGRTFTEADYRSAIADLITFANNHVRTKETALVLDSGMHKTVAGDPSGAPLYKVELLTTGGKSHDALLEAIKGKLWEIAILTGFEYLLLGADGGGSLAMARIKTNDAYRLVSSFLNMFAIVVQRDILRPLWALNGRDPMHAPLPTWDRLEFTDVAEAAGAVLNPLSAAGVTLDRNDKLVNEIIARTGFSPLEADPDPGIDEEAASRFGIGKPKGDGPEGLDPDLEDQADELEDEPPAKVGKRRAKR